MPTNFYLVCPRVTSYWERGIPTIVIHAPSPKSVGREGVYSIIRCLEKRRTPRLIPTTHEILLCWAGTIKFDSVWKRHARLVHHGMLFVPIGYTFSAGMFEMEELKGGSPYGSVVQKLMLVMVQDTQLSLSWSKHSTKASTSPTSQRS
ncbi:hypothetical protein JHK82_043113 [Glycine max]|nr:hypothetical protein JHK82_043113 [Glycine max]